MLLLLLVDVSYGITPTKEETAMSRAWVRCNLLAEKPIMPFSFRYGDTHSSRLLPSWKRTTMLVAENNKLKEYTLIFSDPNGILEVRCLVKEYLYYPSVEWTLFFENISPKDSLLLHNVHAADFDLKNKEHGNYCLYYAEGSDNKVTDFRPLKKNIACGQAVDLACYGGRSSDGYLPFFNIASPDGYGIMLGIGWTGQWAVKYSHKEETVLNIQAGMGKLHAKLLPGETVRTPAIMISFWRNDRMRGHNILRGLLREHYSPQPGGKPLDGPVAISIHGMYSFDGGANEENVLNFIKTVRNHKLPADYLWIDAGWYETTPADKWVYTGTWIPDKRRFPRGLKPIGQTAHKKDLGLILWFEPERVMKDSWLHRNKPQWLLAPDPSVPEDQKDQLDDGFLLNLGNPEALAWAKSNFSKMIKEYGVDVYRQDFNIQPLHHWRNQESPERQGINEIKYIMGLYDFWDTLLKESPGLLIDNCASGGRRIDFETLRRSIPLWRSDECWKPIPEQCMNLGLSLWIPYHGMGSVSLDPYHFWSGTGTNFTIALNIRDHSVWEPATKLLNEFRSIKHLISRDFYPLTAYSHDDYVWMAWQYDSSERGEGLVQAFRRPESTKSVDTFKLSGLDELSHYRLENMVTGLSASLKGSELMDSGLKIVIEDKPGVSLIKYHQIK